jgi:hypothetical protein
VAIHQTQRGNVLNGNVDAACKPHASTDGKVRYRATASPRHRQPARRPVRARGRRGGG